MIKKSTINYEDVEEQFWLGYERVSTPPKEVEITKIIDEAGMKYDPRN